MTDLLTPVLSPRRSAARLLPAKRGHLGIDIGTHSIKLAQVRRNGKQWDLAAQWLLPIPAAPGPAPPAGLQPALAQLSTELPGLRRLFSGRRAAVALPLSLSTLRCLEIPRGSDSEMRAMVREELADDFSDSERFEFDYWEMSPSPSESEGITRLAALATRHDGIHRLTSTLLAARWECHVLDGMSCALARATALAAPAADDAPCVALDLGYTSPQMVVCQQGRPLFCRTLPACGLDALMQPIRDRLQLSDDQCRQLIANVGIPHNTSPHPTAGATRTVFQLISPRLERLALEVKRTLTYIGQQFADQVPRRMFLFGGGANLSGLADFLAASVDLPVTAWQPSPQSGFAGPHCDPQFATAIALSLLAFEKA